MYDVCLPQAVLAPPCGKITNHAVFRDGEYKEQKHAENYYKWHNKFILLTAFSILVISNHNSFRLPFDKISAIYFILKIYLYFITGNGQPMEPALYQLYWHTFIPYRADMSGEGVWFYCYLGEVWLVESEVDVWMLNDIQSTTWHRQHSTAAVHTHRHTTLSADSVLPLLWLGFS